MFRPNPIGLSVVELASINTTSRGTELEIIGGDFLDQTPVLDIKPYLPYVDMIPDALGGYAKEPPELKLQVEFTPRALDQFFNYDHAERIQQAIVQILQLDPRPAYQSQTDNKEYAMRIYDVDVKWRVTETNVLVNAIEPV